MQLFRRLAGTDQSDARSHIHRLRYERQKYQRQVPSHWSKRDSDSRRRHRERDWDRGKTDWDQEEASGVQIRGDFRVRTGVFSRVETTGSQASLSKRFSSSRGIHSRLGTSRYANKDSESDEEEEAQEKSSLSRLPRLRIEVQPD